MANPKPDFGLALQEIEKFSKVFRAFEEIKNAVTVLASYEQNVKELEQRKNQIGKETEKEQEKFNQFILTVGKEKETLVTSNQLSFEQQKKKQEEILAKIVEQQQQQTKSFVEQIDTYNNTLHTLKQDSSSLVKTIENKRQELNQLEMKLSETRKQIATLLKG